MDKINCEMEIITPMFLGGAPQEQNGKILCELRTQTIKGLLRFWWRAYKYGQLNGIQDVESKLSTLQEKESNIFGTVSGTGNKSSFAISVSPKKLGVSTQSLPKHKVEVKTKGHVVYVNILEYLCYGTYEYAKEQKGNRFIREYLKDNQTFNLKFRFENQDYIKEILTTLYLFSEFGGMGSRSRNGFGSLIVRNKEEVFGALGNGFLDNIIFNKDLLNRLRLLGEIPPFTAFSNGIRLFKTVENNYKSWDLCHAELGRIDKDCREKIEPRHSYENRQYIGAPLDPPHEIFKSILGRHSKPYFLKVGKIGKDAYCGIILFIPSYYVYNKHERNEEKRPPFNKTRDNIQFQQTCSLFNDLLTKDKRLEVIL